MRERRQTVWAIWQGIAERLRQRGALVCLAVLLSIGLFEPLGCIIHCAMLDVLYSGSPSVHHHQHSTDAGLGTGGHTAFDQQNVAATSLCPEQHGAALSATTNCVTPIPQPFHEMMLLVVIILVPLALLARRERRSTGPPPKFFSPPLLRPPLLCA